MDVYRKRFGLLVKAFAVISFLVCGFVAVWGTSQNSNFITLFSWGHAMLEVTDFERAQWSGLDQLAEQYSIDLGLLTYAYNGDGFDGYNYTFSIEGSLSIYDTYDTDCALPQQTYESIVLDDGCTIMPISASEEAIVRIDCINRQLYSYETDCHTDYPEVVTFQDNTCTMATLPQGGTFFFQASCTGTSKLADGMVALTGWDSTGDPDSVAHLINGGGFGIYDKCHTFTCTSTQNVVIRSYDSADCTGTYSESHVVVPIATSSSTTVDPLDPSFFGGDSSLTLDFPFDNTYLYVTCLYTSEQVDLFVVSWQNFVYRSFHRCNMAYKSCQQADYNKIGACSRTPLEPEMCRDCYHAGQTSFIILCMTCGIQVPLVWLAISRTSAAGDSRWLKFWSLPLAATAVGGTVAVQIHWQHNCYDKLLEQMEEFSKVYGVETFTAAETYIQLWILLPGVAAFNAFCAWVLNMLTPVPELYQYSTDPVISS